MAIYALGNFYLPPFVLILRVPQDEREWGFEKFFFS